LPAKIKPVILDQFDEGDAKAAEEHRAQTAALEGSPADRRSPSAVGGDAEADTLQAPDDTADDLSCDDSDESCSSDDGTPARRGRRRLDRVCAPMALILENKPLAMMCLVAALVSLPEIVLTDVSVQYALNQFDLIHGDTLKKKKVTLLYQWPGYAVLLPAFLAVGSLAKRFGALRLLRILVLGTGLSLTLPVILRLYPRLWVVPIAGIFVPLSMVVFAPLQTAIAQLAPPDRVGEAMGSIGASKQVAGLVSNLLVSGLVPLLLSTGLRRPLWIFYPMATCSSLLAFAVLLRVKGADESSDAS